MRRPVFLFGLPVLIRVVLGWMMWDSVFSTLYVDDFDRTRNALDWVSDPYLFRGILWLPSQEWLLGGLFRVTGDLFMAAPLAASAVLNTALAVGTAGIVGWTARRVSESEIGAWIVFVAMLFSPWTFHESLSGLSEPIYYLGVAAAVAGLVGFYESAGIRPLLWGSGGVVLAEATRYEGWWLAVAWALCVVVVWYRQQIRIRWFKVLAVAASPFLFPVAWLAHNWAESGDPLRFAELTADIFANAYGGMTPGEAVWYYPSALLRADGVAVVAIGLVALMFWREPKVRLISSLVLVHGFLFCAVSLATRALGPFPERFMFGFVVAAMPIAGLVPTAIGRVPVKWRTGVAVGAMVVAAGSMAAGWLDRPEEWMAAPDHLALMVAVDDLARSTDRITVRFTPDLWEEAERFEIGVGSDATVEIGEVNAGVPDLTVDRLDEWRPTPEGAVLIGRYLIRGRAAGNLDLEAIACDCSDWRFTSENGSVLALPQNPLMWFRFDQLDPAAGAEAMLSTEIDHGIDRVELEVRSLYGHEFNAGRVRVEVRVGGEVIESWDIARRSRWRRISAPVPGGDRRLEVAVVAQPGIESGWGWGVASVVMVRSVETS